MALRKLEVLLAIPEPLTLAQEKVWATTLNGLKSLKAGAVKLNAGAANEEATVKASWHKCYHDEANPQPCVEQEI